MFCFRTSGFHIKFVRSLTIRYIIFRKQVYSILLWQHQFFCLRHSVYHNVETVIGPKKYPLTDNHESYVKLLGHREQKESCNIYVKFSFLSFRYLWFLVLQCQTFQQLYFTLLHHILYPVVQCFTYNLSLNNSCMSKYNVHGPWFMLDLIYCL